MAFCAFDDSAALFDSTPVENMFITEYMLHAPGEFVKVYLYALMLCYHPVKRTSVASMAKDLDMTEEEVDRAFRYWARDGLVRQVGDNPVCYKLFNLKQITLTRAENPSEQLYNRNFTKEIDRILGGRTLLPDDYQLIFDWVDVLDLPEEVVLMLLQIEMEQSHGRVSMRIADEHARQWAQSGVHTVEDVEKIIVLGKEREKQLRRLLRRLGKYHNPSDDEKAMYQKWVEEWGFTPEAIQEACKETTKGTPTMAYLDGILLRQHQLGHHDVKEMESGMLKEHNARDFAREVYTGLGRTGITPTPDDLETISSWKEAGADEALILLAVAAAHRRSGGGNMDDVGTYLTRWRDKGLTTAEAVRAESARVRALNAQLHEVYDAAGMEKRPNAPDRDKLCRWEGELGMNQEMILQAAQYARGMSDPMRFMERILQNWRAAGIATPEAARNEHENHLRGGNAAPKAAAPRTQDSYMRHTPEERRETYSAAMVNFFDEEDDDE